MATSYYRDQLNRLKIDQYGVRVKFYGGNGTETKVMMLNKESIGAIIRWLNSKFLKKRK